MLVPQASMGFAVDAACCWILSPKSNGLRSDDAVRMVSPYSLPWVHALPAVSVRHRQCLRPPEVEVVTYPLGEVLLVPPAREG